MPNVCVYLDDILVTGESEQVHLKTLDEALRRLGKLVLGSSKPNVLS